MKTSFYFVLWILIYPILALLNNGFVENNAFIVALGAVWGVSWLLNRMMPKTLTYERASQMAPILEDVYTGDVVSFRKRLSRETTIETLMAVYFMLTTAVVAISVFKFGVRDWIALAFFAIFTIGAISKSTSLRKANVLLKQNPTPQQCAEIADETYHLDYASYYEARSNATYEDMLPPKPRFFKVFSVFSIVIAAVASLFGLWYIISAIALMVSKVSFDAGAFAGMYFLYGSLAFYYGVKDLISCIKPKSVSPKNVD